MNSKITRTINAVVAAAGVGRRMGADIPKQYLKISDKTIIEHTLERLISASFIDEIIVVISSEDDYFKELPISSNPKISITYGGKERADSVLNGLKAAKSEYVLVHDAARPCVLISDIEKLVLSSTNEHGGILAAPVCDTMKLVDTDKNILKTIPRNGLFRALTPQYFQRQTLIKAYEEASLKGLVITDEASAMEFFGFSPKVVLGNCSNIKITEKQDLSLAEFYLSRQTN